MSTLAWIVSGGIAMAVISLAGALTLLLDEATQRRLVRPLVAFAAGSLLGGAIVHMIPEATAQGGGRCLALPSLSSPFHPLRSS